MMLALLLAIVSPAHAEEPDCTLRSWPADGSTDVPANVQHLFFEGSGVVARTYSVIARVDGVVVSEREGMVARSTIPEPPGPGRLVELDITWEADPPDEGFPAPECSRTVRFTTAAESTEADGDFSELTLDTFQVKGGAYPSYTVEGSFPGTGNQVVVITPSPTATFIDHAWVVPTEAQPDFAVTTYTDERGSWAAKECVQVWASSPTTWVEPIDEVCGRGCSSLPASPAPWALGLAGLLLLRRRRQDRA